MPRDLRILGYTVGQFPNPPLRVALAALAIGLVTDEGSTVSDVARAVFYVAVTVWAYEEVARGVNGFRRALSAVALVLSPSRGRSLAQAPNRGAAVSEAASRNRCRMAA